MRKGGLREEGRHFDLQSTRFWLYPTAEHQKPELLKEPYRHWIDLASAAPVGEPIRIDGWADVDHAAEITEPEQLDALGVEADLDPRVRRVTVGLEARATRSGCSCSECTGCSSRSRFRGTTPTVAAPVWVDLDGLPDDPESVPSELRAVRRRVRGSARRARSKPCPHSPPSPEPRRPDAQTRRASGVVADALERAVPAVAGLGQGVGRERGELLRRDELGDASTASRGRRCRGRTRPACACRPGTGSPRTASVWSWAER